LPVILNRVKNLVLLLKGFYPRFFALKTRAQNDTTRSFGREKALRMTNPGVVLSNAKDLGLPVILSAAIAEHPEYSEGRI
jgi:hypothetical protein